MAVANRKAEQMKPCANTSTSDTRVLDFWPAMRPARYPTKQLANVLSDLWIQNGQHKIRMHLPWASARTNANSMHMMITVTRCGGSSSRLTCLWLSSRVTRKSGDIGCAATPAMEICAKANNIAKVEDRINAAKVSVETWGVVSRHIGSRSEL